MIPIGNPLIQWEPKYQCGSLYDKFIVFFNDSNGLPSEMQWTPAMDIIANEFEMMVRMDTPGMERKDLKVKVNDGLLVIHGERKHEYKDEKAVTIV